MSDLVVVGASVGVGAILGVLSARAGGLLTEALDQIERDPARPDVGLAEARAMWREGRGQVGLRWVIAHGGVTAIVAGAAAAAGMNSLQSVVLATAGGLLAFGALIDLRTFWLPDTVTMPLLWLVLLAAACGVGSVPASDAVIGAALGWGFFALCRMIGNIAYGQPSVGGGDLRLAAGCGAMCGAESFSVFALCLAAAMLINVVGWRILARRQGAETWVPLGPAIAVAGFLAMVIVVQRWSWEAVLLW